MAVAYSEVNAANVLPLYHNYKYGMKAVVDGVSGSTVELDFVKNSYNQEPITMVDLKTTGAAVNDFDLPDGVHGQEVLVKLTDKPSTSTATVTPDSGVTVVQRDGSTAMASVTFDTVGEFALFRYEFNRWVLMHTSGVVA